MSVLVIQGDNLLPSVNEMLIFTVKQAKTNIFAWKLHILRNIHQDAARVDVLETLDESSVGCLGLGYEISAQKVP